MVSKRFSDVFIQPCLAGLDVVLYYMSSWSKLRLFADYVSFVSSSAAREFPDGQYVSGSVQADSVLPVRKTCRTVWVRERSL